MHIDMSHLDDSFSRTLIRSWMNLHAMILYFKAASGLTDSTLADPKFEFIQILWWQIQDLESYRFYGGGSRVWINTDSTVMDPGFGLIQILQWSIQGLGSYRFSDRGSRIWTHTDSTVVDPGFGLKQILQWWIQDLDSNRFYSGGSRI